MEEIRIDEDSSQLRDSRRSSPPPSGGSPSPNDGDDAGEVERVHPSKLHGPDGDPPFIKPLRFNAGPAERALYEEAFKAAWEFPHDLMHVMSGIRKGLKRGKEAAAQAGGGPQ